MPPPAAASPPGCQVKKRLFQLMNMYGLSPMHGINQAAKKKGKKSTRTDIDTGRRTIHEATILCLTIYNNNKNNTKPRKQYYKVGK